jgi:hypothetical protein
MTEGTIGSKKKGPGFWWYLYMILGVFLVIVGAGYLVMTLVLPEPVEMDGEVVGHELYLGGTGAKNNPHNHCYKLTVQYVVDGQEYSKTTRWPVKNFRDCERTDEEAEAKAKTWYGRKIKVYYQDGDPKYAETEGERGDRLASTPILGLVGLVIIGWGIYRRVRPKKREDD